ncbi:MAG: hypothetical protein IIA10_04370 [Proteobacteria bacterium]|nr:hypothetical protein [Pseudomonadota bacterium]
MTTKIYRRCGIEKPIEEFNKAKKNKDGYNIRCKSCAREMEAFRKEKFSESQTPEQQKEARQKMLKRSRELRAAKPAAEREYKNLMRKLAEYLREIDELTPLVERIQTEENWQSDIELYAINSGMEWVNKTRFYVKGRPEGLTNIEKRHYYMMHRVSPATPEMIDEAVRKEIDKEAGLTGPGDSAEMIKMGEEWDADRAQRATEIPTPEFMANNEARWHVLNNFMPSRDVAHADAMLRHEQAKVRWTRSDSGVNKAQRRVEELEAEQQERDDELYQEHYSMRLPVWQAKAETGEIRTFAEEVPDFYAPREVKEIDPDKARAEAEARLKAKRVRTSTLLDDYRPEFDNNE